MKKSALGQEKAAMLRWIGRGTGEPRHNLTMPAGHKAVATISSLVERRLAESTTGFVRRIAGNQLLRVCLTGKGRVRFMGSKPERRTDRCVQERPEGRYRLKRGSAKVAYTVAVRTSWSRRNRGPAGNGPCRDPGHRELHGGIAWTSVPERRSRALGDNGGTRIRPLEAAPTHHNQSLLAVVDRSARRRSLACHEDAAAVGAWG